MGLRDDILAMIVGISVWADPAKHRSDVVVMLVRKRDIDQSITPRCKTGKLAERWMKQIS